MNSEAGQAESGDRTRSFWNERHSNEGADESKQEFYALASPRFVEAHHGKVFAVDDPSRGQDWLGWLRKELENRVPFKRILFLGCGDASALIDLHARGFSTEILGVDISDSVIQVGREKLEGLGLQDEIRLEVGNLDEYTWEPGRFDAVVCVMSLHHAMDVRKVVERIQELLPPSGVFVANEYVGPNRWQFTTLQLTSIRGVMALLPRRLKRRPDGTVKPILGRPPLEWMIETDPSEAADSESIPGALRESFRNLIEKDYWGGLALPVLDETMGAYRLNSGFDLCVLKAVAWLDRALTKLRIVPNCNTLFVARKG